MQLDYSDALIVFIAQTSKPTIKDACSGSFDCSQFLNTSVLVFLINYSTWYQIILMM